MDHRYTSANSSGRSSVTLALLPSSLLLKDGPRSRSGSVESGSSRDSLDNYVCIGNLAGSRACLQQTSRASYISRTLREDVRILDSGRSGSDPWELAAAFLSSSILKKRQHWHAPPRQFCTGSRYFGSWGRLGFHHQGIYRFPHGVIYMGGFNQEGQFHGNGTLIYPNGQKLQGVWRNGKLKDHTYTYDTGITCDREFPNGDTSDRRFHIEIGKDLGAVDDEYLTKDETPVQLPEGCYDLTNEIYDSIKGVIYKVPRTQNDYDYEDILQGLSAENRKHFRELLDYKPKDEEELKTYLMTIDMAGDSSQVHEQAIEIPCKAKVAWIKRHCRKAWDEPCGYQRRFFRYWMAGRAAEIEAIECEIQLKGIKEESSSSSDSEETEMDVSGTSEQKHLSNTAETVSFIQKIPRSKTRISKKKKKHVVQNARLRELR